MTEPSFPTITPSVPSFPVTIEEDWGQIVTEMQSGHQETRSLWSKPRRIITWNMPTLTKANKNKILAFLRDRKGGGNYFYITNTETVYEPYDAPTLSQTAGGNLGARTLYVKITWSDGTNETIPSQEASLSVDASKLMSVAIPFFPSGVTQARIYIGTSTGAEKYCSKQTTSGATWSELETYVDTDSASGQKVLNVDSSTGFQAGDLLILNSGGPRQEVCTVDTTGVGTITMVSDLSYTHTQVQGDKVNHDNTGGAALPTTNTLTEEIKVALLGKPIVTRKSSTVYSISMVMVEQF
jgi:hypothetical protein